MGNKNRANKYADKSASNISASSEFVAIYDDFAGFLFVITRTANQLRA